MMLDTMVLNSPVWSTVVLIASVIEVLLQTATRIVIGYLYGGFNTVDLTSKIGKCLVVSASPAVDSGQGRHRS